jgi:hypothetical protein
LFRSGGEIHIAMTENPPGERCSICAQRDALHMR